MTTACTFAALQTHSSLKTIKKKLVRKALDAIKKMADDDVSCKEAEKSDAESDADNEKPSEEQCKAFGTLWKEFGRALKLGIMEDDNNRSEQGCRKGHASRQHCV